MAKLNLYLNYAGNCRDAMTFYKECLGGELKIQTMGESPVAAQMPPEAANNVMHSTLTNDAMVLMASDAMNEEINRGNSMSLMLNCESEEEINRYFNALSQGGQVVTPLRKEFWGGIFGQFTDKFGVAWMMNYEKH